jgi:hypothetical protein
MDNPLRRAAECDLAGKSRGSRPYGKKKSEEGVLDHRPGFYRDSDREQSVFASEEGSVSRWRCGRTLGQRTRHKKQVARGAISCFCELCLDPLDAGVFDSRNMIVIS